jgi:signal transduction histidine kinase
MKVFLSWSGTRSRLLAAALRDWLPNVLQLVQPWMSDTDIRSGGRWSADLAKELEQTEIGIICVTPENQDTPWVMFEAGAISKVVATAAVIPYLYDLPSTELKGPLVQFQATAADREGTWKVLVAVNSALNTLALPAEILRRSFEKWWPDLEATVASIPDSREREPHARPDRELLEEVLVLAREGTRSQAEKALMVEQASQLKLQDFAVLTHHLQARLVATRAGLLGLQRHELSAAVLRRLGFISDITEDLLAFTYGVTAAFLSEQGTLVAMAPDAVDIAQLAEVVATRLLRTSAREDLTVSVAMDDSFRTLTVDRSVLMSVVYNLVDNAMHYADRGSTVTLYATRTGPDDHPVLRITSIGEILEDDERATIFDKFVRGRIIQRTGRHHAGAGLGLWVARQLMRHVGGDITVGGDAAARATTFVIHFSSEWVDDV